MQFLANGKEGERSILAYVKVLSLVIGVFFMSSVLLVLDWKISFQDAYPDLFLTDKEAVEIMGANRFLFWILVPFALGLLTFIILAPKVHQRNLLSWFTKRDKFDFRRFFYSFFLFGAITLVLFGINFMLNPDLEFRFKPAQFVVLLLVSLPLIPLQTTFEEVIFRSYTLQGMFARTGSWLISAILSSIFFMILHGGNPEVETLGWSVLPYYFLVGFFLSLVAIFDDGIELTMGYHAANNLITALLVTTDWQAFQTDALFVDGAEPQFGIENWIGLFMILPLLFWHFMKKYKWNFKKQVE